MTISEQRRREVIGALRRGTVPSHSLDALAVGLGRFEGAIEKPSTRRLSAKRCSRRSGVTRSGQDVLQPLARHARPGARVRQFRDPDLQDKTPLHRLETVYRRLTEHLTTAEFAPGALRQVVDAVYALEQDVLAEQQADSSPSEAELAKRVEQGQSSG